METTAQRTARLLSMSNAALIMHAQDLTLERDTLQEALSATVEQRDRFMNSEEQMRSDFCAAINHAIGLGIDAAIFLQCWNEGDWDGCRDFGFEPSAAMKGQ